MLQLPATCARPKLTRWLAPGGVSGSGSWSLALAEALLQGQRLTSVQYASVQSPAEKANLAGTGMLQVWQLRVEPWWKAVVVVKVSSIVARHTGDLLFSPRVKLIQGIGDSCWSKVLQRWQVPSSLGVTRNPGLRGMATWG